MLIACWSPKGGCGTTVTSVALGLVLAAAEPSGALLADLAGDVPAVLGLPDASGLGLADWLSADTDVPDDALQRLETEAGPGLALLPTGGATRAGLERADRGSRLAVALAGDPRPVVADCGLASDGAPLAVAAGADVSLLVLRPCYLALRRALAAPIRPSGIVLVNEEERSLGSRDMEDVLGAPVYAVVPVEASIARAVDAGLLARRLPRHLATAAQRVAASLPGTQSTDDTVPHLSRRRWVRRP